jgi:hypothetical protein
MTIDYYDISIAYFIRGLYTLSHILEKTVEYAKEKNIDLAEIPKWRLVDDMNPFSFQIQTASNTPKNTIARITKKELEKWEDNETTIEQLVERINKTITLLKSVEKSSFSGKESVEVVMQSGGQERKLNGLTYLQNFAIPNFYFHVSTAYDILRSKGVPLGKKDFLSGGSTAAAEGF